MRSNPPGCGCLQGSYPPHGASELAIKYQFIDLADKGISKGELASVMQAVGGLDALLDKKAKDQVALALVRYLAPQQKVGKVLEHPLVLRQPIVRNGRKATVGYPPGRVEDLGVIKGEM